MLRKRDGKITLYHKRRKKSLEEKASCNFQQKRDDATTLSLMLGTLPYTQVYVGTFEVFVLAHVASRISSSPSWIRHPRQFLPPPAFFVYNYLKVKSARGTPKWNGVLEKKMRTCAFKNAHNSDMRIENKGQVFTRVGLLVDLYSVQGRRNHGGYSPPRGHI